MTHIQHETIWRKRDGLLSPGLHIRDMFQEESVAFDTYQMLHIFDIPPGFSLLEDIPG